MKGVINLNIEIFRKYDSPQKTQKFKKELIEIRGNQCECCKHTEWLNQPINLELHHIDGDKSNNELNNLQLLCPNCHSYTDNFGSKNIKRKYCSDEELIEALKNSKTIRQALISLQMSDAGVNYTRARALIKRHNIKLLSNSNFPKENFCIDCHKPIYPTAIRCSECYGKIQRQVDISREELKNLIRTTPFTQIGKQFNVSDNAIRKWCDKYSLPRTVKEIKQYSDEEWKLI